MLKNRFHKLSSKAVFFLYLSLFLSCLGMLAPSSVWATSCVGEITFDNNSSKRLIVHRILAKFKNGNDYKTVWSGESKIDAGSEKILSWSININSIGGASNCVGKLKEFKFRYRAKAGGTKKRTQEIGKKDGTFRVIRTGKTTFNYTD